MECGTSALECGMSSTQLKSPLMPVEPQGACACCNSEGAYRVWNIFLLCLGALLAAESGFCTGIGLQQMHQDQGEQHVVPGAGPEGPLLPVEPAAGSGDGATAQDLVEIAGEEGLGTGQVLLCIAGFLAFVAVLQIGLAASALCGCRCRGRKKRRECATCLHVLYFTGSALVIAAEVLLALLLFLLRHWHGFQYSFDVTIEDQDPQEWTSLKLVISILQVELIISVFLQVGALVFHVMRTCGHDGWDGATASEPDFTRTTSASSYGSRLDSFGEQGSASRSKEPLTPEQEKLKMREYYASLYAQNGLAVPKLVKYPDAHVSI